MNYGFIKQISFLVVLFSILLLSSCNVNTVGKAIGGYQTNYPPIKADENHNCPPGMKNDGNDNCDVECSRGETAGTCTGRSLGYPPPGVPGDAIGSCSQAGQTFCCPEGSSPGNNRCTPDNPNQQICQNTDEVWCQDKIEGPED